MTGDISPAKTLHLLTAGLSLAGFVVRGIWMLRDSPRLQARWTRVLPHINDTVLLGAGLWMVVATAQYPTEQAWLAAKLVALVIYILLGTVALKRGRTRAIRVGAFVSALLVFGYIVSVALTRSALPFLA